MPTTPDTPPGSLVRLAGLQSAAGRKLNGKLAFLTASPEAPPPPERAPVVVLPFSRGDHPITIKHLSLTLVDPQSLQPAQRLTYIRGLHDFSAALLRANAPDVAVAQLDTLIGVDPFPDVSKKSPPPASSKARGKKKNSPKQKKAAPSNVAPPPAVLRADVVVLRAQALRAASRYAQAVDGLSAFLECAADLPPVVRANLQSELVLSHADQGSLVGALDVIDDMLATRTTGTDAPSEEEVTGGAGDDDGTDREREDEERREVDGAIAQVAQSTMLLTITDGDDALIRRACQALLSVRPRHVGAMRALGHVLERARDKQRASELLHESAAADGGGGDGDDDAVVQLGALVKIAGCKSDYGRSLNGRFAAVVPGPPDLQAGDVAIALLPIEDDSSLMQIGRGNVVPPGPNVDWPVDLAEDYVDAITECAGNALRSNVRSAREMVERAVMETRGLEVDGLPTMLFVLWVALRTGGLDAEAEKTLREIEAIDSESATSALMQISRMTEMEAQVKSGGGGGGGCNGCCSGGAQSAECE